MRTPIYQLAKIISKQKTVNPIDIRKEQFKILFRSNMETEDTREIKTENTSGCTDPPLTSRVPMVNLLENLFVYYQEIFKDNWNSMTSPWYQNHRSIALYTRKPGVQHGKGHPPIKVEHSSIPYAHASNMIHQKSKSTARTLILISNRTRLLTAKTKIQKTTTPAWL